ncbi:MAG TPA: hypothetical protein O0X32_03660 [Methanocorpusculum sp.]|nr:hypothetical protein [Methanocorpusculum sp.]
MLAKNSEQQQGIVKRAGIKGHRNYFGSKQTQYVRDYFYCTFCKREIAFNDRDGDVRYGSYSSYDSYPCCKKGANAYRIWVEQRKNIKVTEEYNGKIDAVMNEVADLETEMKEEVARQKEEQQKKNIEQGKKNKSTKSKQKKKSNAKNK